MRVTRNARVVADDDVIDNVVVEPEATDLLFEAEDVAELLAEVTQQPVEVTADEDAAVFAVGDDEFTVSADGDEELVEASTAVVGKKRRRTVSAATKRTTTKRTIRKLPSSK